MLTTRRNTILKAVVDEYVNSAIPVASKKIVDNYNLNCSSATVRNDLAYLEEYGYINQPHTSSGRIPTDAGYREIVNEFIENFSINSYNNSYEKKFMEFSKKADELENFIDNLTESLSQITSCLTLYIPYKKDFHINKIYKKGLSEIIKQPEFSNSLNLLPFIKVIEDDELMIDLFLNCDNKQDCDLKIKIGHENCVDGLYKFSTFAKTFKNGSDYGVLVIIGPTRMNYCKSLDVLNSAIYVIENS